MIVVSRKNSLNGEDWNEIFEKLQLAVKAQAARSFALKPNFVRDFFKTEGEPASMTDLELLSSLLTYLCGINKEARIFICESDSTGYGFAYQKFEQLRLPYSLSLSFKDVQRVRLLDLSRDRLIRIEDDRFLRFHRQHQLWLSQTFFEADFKISLANLKTHNLADYSGACKNLFGCLPETNKHCHHAFIARTIHDLALAIRPDLNILDGFRAMEGNGPTKGQHVDLGFRLFSDSALEADLNGSRSMGFEPAEIKHLELLLRTNGVKDWQPALKEQVKLRRVDRNIRLKNSMAMLLQRLGCRVAALGCEIYDFESLSEFGEAAFRKTCKILFGKGDGKKQGKREHES
ncbi:MAG: DUF362 domain-containing protein [Acidaminococcaceae bacterium]|nr:DUF362 domain-containing protein [Acidaminococcaceae bacterium]